MSLSFSSPGGLDRSRMAQAATSATSPYNRWVAIGGDGSGGRHHHLTTSPPSSIQMGQDDKKWQHLYVLPVLLLEFLAIALTRAVLPGLLVQKFARRTYLIMGVADCVRGLLAFGACPVFGKLSDIVGRRWCLLVTVLGTCAPVCSLAFFHWRTTITWYNNDDVAASSVPEHEDEAAWPSPWSSNKNNAPHSQVVIHQHPHALTVFVILLSLSGIFSSTFTLVFAYISDTVRKQDERVAAYGLALATFGLSFTLGPMAGGYLAQHQPQHVFVASTVLTVLDLLYIYYVLPESRPPRDSKLMDGSDAHSHWSTLSQEHNIAWNPWDTMRVLLLDPFLRTVGQVAFFYYTGLWAVISTLSVYAVQRFQLGPERLGELMSALGLCTMVAEAALVRIMVPMLGEKRAMKLGLISFAVQCVVLGFAYEPWHLFVCALFSLLGNLVYPSLSSLVSGSVEPDAVGEALGAVNGVKALTEGIGPLVFGSLMTMSEKSALPGWPYLVAAGLIVAAYFAADDLPDDNDEDFVHELVQHKFRRKAVQSSSDSGVLMQAFACRRGSDDDTGEYGGLLSDVDEHDEADTTTDAADAMTDAAVVSPTLRKEVEDLSKLPNTFASLFKARPVAGTETLR